MPRISSYSHTSSDTPTPPPRCHQQENICTQPQQPQPQPWVALPHARSALLCFAQKRESKHSEVKRIFLFPRPFNALSSPWVARRRGPVASTLLCSSGQVREPPAARAARSLPPPAPQAPSRRAACAPGSPLFFPRVWPRRSSSAPVCPTGLHRANRIQATTRRRSSRQAGHPGVSSERHARARRVRRPVRCWLVPRYIGTASAAAPRLAFGCLTICLLASAPLLQGQAMRAGRRVHHEQDDVTYVLLSISPPCQCRRPSTARTVTR